MKNILILGYSGALGSELTNSLANNSDLNCIHFSKLNIIDSKNINLLSNFILEKNIHIVINCIAFNGYDNCEINQSKANNINAIFLDRILDKISNHIECFIHFSTEAVFNGSIENKLYDESDLPDPLTLYGQTKLNGEKILLKFNNVLIFRLPLLFGPFHKKQIVYKLLNIVEDNKYVRVSKDVFSTPLYSPIISNFIIKILTDNSFTELKGSNKIYHLTSNYYCSMFDLLKYLASKVNKEEFIIPELDCNFKKLVKKPKFLGLKSSNFTFDFSYNN